MSWSWYNESRVDQWDRIEEPETNPNTYVYFIFGKGAKTIQWEKTQHFLQMVLVELAVNM